MKSRLKLGVNIDHVASLRQARRTVYPSVLEAAGICEAAGADGITVHLREDRRHIQDDDVRQLKKRVKTRLNLELANSPEIVGIALDVVPDEICMVPERREELTTEGGLNVAAGMKSIGDSVCRFRKAGISVSLFIDAREEQIRAAAELGAEYIELHTGRYCDSTGREMEEELRALVEGARLARSLGLKVNAGHGINLDNLPGILSIPFMDTLNIGHSIVARSVFVGLDEAVREMMRGMENYAG